MNSQCEGITRAALQVHSWHSRGENKFAAVRRYVRPRAELRTSPRLRHTITDEVGHVLL